MLFFLDEAGHFLGLAHTRWYPSSTMAESALPGEISMLPPTRAPAVRRRRYRRASRPATAGCWLCRPRLARRPGGCGVVPLGRRRAAPRAARGSRAAAAGEGREARRDSRCCCWARWPRRSRSCPPTFPAGTCASTGRCGSMSSTSTPPATAGTNPTLTPLSEFAAIDAAVDNWLTVASGCSDFRFVRADGDRTPRSATSRAARTRT